MEILQVPLGERLISLSIRRHSRARRISLRLSAGHDGIVLTLPVRASVASGMEFFASKAKWVLTHVKTDDRIAFAEGTSLPILGKDYVILRRDGRGVSRLIEHPASLTGELEIFGAPEFTPRRVRDFLKKHIQEACLARAKSLAKTLGKTVREVKVRDTRSRWGSCSAGGVLTFHWRLVFAPPGVFDYLIAHEVAHLKEMNHSPRFWAIVRQLCPDFDASKRWLKIHGHHVNRFGK